MLKFFHIIIIIKMSKIFTLYYNFKGGHLKWRALLIFTKKNILKSLIFRVKNVYYNLVKTISDNLTYFGIEIILKNGINNPEEAFFDGISESENYVRNIIKFLYENSIKPDVSLEIISDLVSEMEYISWKNVFYKIYYEKIHFKYTNLSSFMFIKYIITLVFKNKNSSSF